MRTHSSLAAGTLAALTVLLGVSSGCQRRVPHMGSLAEAKQQATATGKPILVDVYADW